MRLETTGKLHLSRCFHMPRCHFGVPSCLSLRIWTWFGFRLKLTAKRVQYNSPKTSYQFRQPRGSPFQNPQSAMHKWLVPTSTEIALMVLFGIKETGDLKPKSSTSSDLLVLSRDFGNEAGGFPKGNKRGLFFSGSFQSHSLPMAPAR